MTMRATRFMVASTMRLTLQPFCGNMQTGLQISMLRL